MAGAVAGGALTAGLSWRWVFLINVPIGAVLITAGRPRPSPDRPRRAWPCSPARSGPASARHPRP
ncbi:hypothetical protein [Actinomadura madurae]|uniref:hypothetical protein n=1 Tax=Actinomadura madurae TaxID=1993 RepID=UPI0009434D24|nr:hypothetical protein [Actinomadura madurae]